MAKQRTRGKKILVTAVLALVGTFGGAASGHGATVAVSRVSKELVSPHGVAVDERAGRVFVLDEGYLDQGRGTVAVLDARSGALLRVTPVGLYPVAIAVDERTGRAFVVNNGLTRDVPGSVSVLDTRTGRALRTVMVDKHPLAVAVDRTTGRVFVATVGNTGNGYAATVNVLDATSGSVLGAIAVDNSPTAMAVDERAGRVVVAGDYQTKILDAATGAPVSVVAAGNHPRAALVDERAGRVFLANADGSMDVLDARSGAGLRTITAPTPDNMAGINGVGIVSAAVDEQAGRVIVGETTAAGAGAGLGGHVGIMDTTTGRTLGDIALQAQPMALAVAARAGRIFVLESHGGDANVASSVDVIDMARGTLRHAATFNAFMSAMGVDEKTAHVFVAGLNTVSMLDADGTLLRTVALPAR